MFQNEDQQLFLQELLNAFQIPYILFDTNKRIQAMFLSDSLSNEFNMDNIQFQEFLNEIESTKKIKKEVLHFHGDNKISTQGTPIIHAGNMLGILVSFSKNSNLDNKELTDIENENMANDLNALFESSYDVIFVSDANGVALRVSSACEKLFGIKKEDFVGRSTFELEQEGFFRPSVTRLVLESKKKLSVIQKTSTGKTLLVTGTPIFDESGNITRIVNASRNITEIDQLKIELQESKEISERYQREIQHLKLKESKSDQQLTYRSKSMEKLVEQAKKIAEYNSNILITGESGVGKEIIASLIHETSNRFDKPFVKINFAAIPEAIMELELYGYEKNTFAGSSEEGRKGLFHTAHQGTIFIDEITEIPLALQPKISQFLHDGEMYRIGSTERINVDVRVIASTKKNIKELIALGKFNEDLYYKLNVIQIDIPPLRQRKEDIPLLIDYFNKKFNEEFGTQRKFSLDMIQEMQEYEWSGNVRELKNCIERLIVTSDSDTIDTNMINLFVENSNASLFTLELQNVDDLKKALLDVEKSILENAVKKHKTTIQIAKVLNTTQSSISKKLMRYNIKLK